MRLSGLVFGFSSLSSTLVSLGFSVLKLSPRAFHRKMFSGQEVAGHAGFYVMVQCSVSQLCKELQKLESWSAADP